MLIFATLLFFLPIRKIFPKRTFPDVHFIFFFAYMSNMEYEMMKYSFVVCIIQMQTCTQLNVTLKSKQRAALTSV